MKIWLIWIQEMEHEKHTWLEGSWDDESIAENHDGWKAEVDRCRKLASEGNYEVRIQAVEVPGVFELFNIPTVVATAAS